jgi:hypothetical protein
MGSARRFGPSVGSARNWYPVVTGQRLDHVVGHLCKLCLLLVTDFPGRSMDHDQDTGLQLDAAAGGAALLQAGGGRRGSRRYTLPASRCLQ